MSDGENLFVDLMAFFQTLLPICKFFYSIVRMSSGVIPKLNSRTLGWLSYLHKKCLTEDDWSEDGEPLDWWDKSSNPPVLSFARFDLSESSYALGLMADVTPAWREVYSEILNGLCERHLTYWAAYDWLTQFGHDPDRNNYPKEWIDLWIPDHKIGEYDTPGWVANGIEPWGLQADPIGADGNLFFKGWLNLIQCLHVYTKGEDTWGQPFQVAGVDRTRFEWTQHTLVSHLTSQWQENPFGPHCENTKIWPYCLSAAGLGLKLYDSIFHKESHSVFHEWVEFTKGKYYGFDASGGLEWTPIYYDPIIDHVHAAGPSNGLTIAFYMIPQDPIFAEYLYRTATKKLGWDNTKKGIKIKPNLRFLALGLACAKEFGDLIVESRLKAFAEENFEPRWFGKDNMYFGHFFNLKENWPRGQWAALAMMSEVGEKGAWSNLFRNPNLEKFGAPTLSGVDFPDLMVSSAYNNKRDGTLYIALTSQALGKLNKRTSIKISNLPDPNLIKIKRDGATYDSWRINQKNEIELDTTYSTTNFQIYTGWSATEAYSSRKFKTLKTSVEGNNRVSAKASSVKLVNVSCCPCCPSLGT